MSRYQNNNLYGICLMMLAVLLFAVMDAMAKWLLVEERPVAQILFFRSWVIVSLILLLLAVRGQLDQLKTRRPGFHLIRGMIGFLAPFCFFLALKSLPLADATVVFFSSSFILTAGSALFLREQVGVHRWSAVVVGFIGVVIAMNPSGDGDLNAYGLVLVSATIYAALFLTGKHLSRNDSVMLLVFSFNFGVGVVATLALPWWWQLPDAATLFKI